MSNIALKDVLSERARRWSAQMANADTGPLAICEDVVAVVDAWDQYRAQVDGLTAEAWLVSIFRPGRGVRFWRERVGALATLETNRDGSARRCLHHEAAVWLAGLSDGMREKTFFRCLQESKKTGAPVPESTARRLHKQTHKLVSKPRTCRQCSGLQDEIARLRGLLSAHGIPWE